MSADRISDYLTQFATARTQMAEQLGKVVIGQADVVEQILAAVFTRGHCLLVGVPGLAKTLIVSSIGNFRRSRTSIIPVRPATALVIAGPYRFTRNPMYVALAALTVGLGLFLDSWWVMLLLVPVLIGVRLFVIAPEERYLQRRFGADYISYMRRVRRWV